MNDELTSHLTEALLSHDAERVLRVIRDAVHHVVREAFGRAAPFVEEHLFTLWGPIASAQARRSDVREADGESLIRRLRFDADALAW